MNARWRCTIALCSQFCGVSCRSEKHTRQREGAIGIAKLLKAFSAFPSPHSNTMHQAQDSFTCLFEIMPSLEPNLVTPLAASLRGDVPKCPFDLTNHCTGHKPLTCACQELQQGCQHFATRATLHERSCEGHCGNGERLLDCVPLPRTVSSVRIATWPYIRACAILSDDPRSEATLQH